MSEYEVVCTIPSDVCPDQRHIERIGIATRSGPPKLLKTADVWLALAMDHVFYTQSSDDGVTMTLEAWVCATCHLNTLRSNPHPSDRM
ncbi:MAG: hypothetical protein ABJA81_10915 [Nocardioidaceae bacterium]